MGCPCVGQCPQTSLRVSFPDFYPMIRRGGQDTGAVKIDMKDSDSVMVAGLKLVDLRHLR